MRSPTQRNLDNCTIDGLIAPALGARVAEAAELSGGGFAAVWRATLTDGREVVVKVGPPPSARLLRYESGLIEAEAAYLRGYTAATGLVLDGAARTRLALYRILFHVLMLAEGPSRGIPVGGERHVRLTGLLEEELRDL